jgi:hypothetical protein
VADFLFAGVDSAAVTGTTYIVPVTGEAATEGDATFAEVETRRAETVLLEGGAFRNTRGVGAIGRLS